MNRDDAIKILKAMNMMMHRPDGTPISDGCEAMDMAIEALQTDTIEFDFNKYHPSVRNKVYDHDSVKVVRCKDCYWYDKRCRFSTMGNIKNKIGFLPSAEAEWIPVKTRPMDEEERREWSEKFGYDIEYDEAVIYTSQLPDDGQAVLTCSRYGNIAIDIFENDPDYGCGFEENGDMDGIVAWMPLPMPYREDGEE